jgi:hypothetical protein
MRNDLAKALIILWMGALAVTWTVCLMTAFLCLMTAFR